MRPLNSRDPKSIGGFTLINRLGAGGMGDVFLAERGGQNVAIKVIRDSFADDPNYIARFTREINIVKIVSHPNVIGFVDLGTDDGRLWYASEFAHGPTLDQMVRSSGPLSEEAWELFARGLLEGLEAFHQHSIVHRDIKPANVIMSPWGPKIIDLGVARGDDETSLTNSGMTPGSPAWFSPEQILGKEVTTASDYFSAGSVLVFAATGRGPWGPPTSVTYENVGTKLFEKPDLSRLSPNQQSLVVGLLDQDPQFRLNTVRQLLGEAKKILTASERPSVEQTPQGRPSDLSEFQPEEPPSAENASSFAKNGRPRDFGQWALLN